MVFLPIRILFSGFSFFSFFFFFLEFRDHLRISQFRLTSFFNSYPYSYIMQNGRHCLVSQSGPLHGNQFLGPFLQLGGLESCGCARAD